MKQFLPIFFCSILLCAAPVRAGDVLVEDAGVSITAAEFRAILETMPPSIRATIADDVGERLEIINSLLLARKIAALADQVSPDDDGYWDLHSAIISAKYKFMYERLQGEIKEPDFEPLARERYAVNTEKYARIPEFRSSSHILLRSPPGLDRTEVRLKAQEILDELRRGADFVEMVEQYSDDPGSKARGGSLGKFIKFGDPKITPPYSEALFAIENIGEYSEITDSQFGVHIIRLDGIQPSSLAQFEQVKDVIIADLKREYATLANAELRARYNITDQLYIDGPEMEMLLAPYKDPVDADVNEIKAPGG
jgi:hypothetical protein